MYLDPYLLGKVYQRGSLKNTPHGFQFTLKNIVDSATLGGVNSLRVDDNELSLDAITIKTPDGEHRVKEISYRNPLPLRFNAEVTVSVAGTPLDLGVHNFLLILTVLEAGRLQFAFQDEVVTASAEG